MKNWTVICLVLFCAVCAREIGNAVGLRALRRDEIVLAILVFPPIVLDYRRMWAIGRFWCVVLLFVIGHCVVIWLIFERLIHGDSGIGLIPMLLIGAAEAYAVGYTLARSKYLAMSAEHR
ncbi:MAG TPA: hypothetical protein VFU76_14345 [Terriglobales bacterium]|nr:hypothetical protein [Terriglobales bacterium]